MEQGAKPLWVIQAVKNPEERSEVVRLPGPALSGLLLRASCLPPLSQPEPWAGEVTVPPALPQAALCF